MPTIIEINNNNYGSTGNIMLNIAEEARKKGFDVYTCSKNSIEGKKFNQYPNQIFIGIWIERIISEKLAFITSLRDFFNIFGTLIFIRKIKKIKPDIIHLHNVHGSFLNISLFFKYLKKSRIPVVWTLHDIWPVTGLCASYYRCNKWITGCKKCIKLHEYPGVLFFDNTKYMWKYKKSLFTSLQNVHYVTPSIFYQSLLKKSFLYNYHSIVINNGINLNIFKPCTNNDVREKYNIKSKYLVLSVANFWDYSKGIDILVGLSKSLSKDYQLIIVGTNDEIDKTLPNNIISIHRTYDKNELINLYSSADVFVNPTRDDNFPTVNMESLACGTPVITFDTGGSAEIIDSTCGYSIKPNNLLDFKNAIIETCEKKPFSSVNCLERSQLYDMNKKYSEYIKLYQKLLK